MLVKVHNKNTYPFIDDNFEGKRLEIGAGKYREMERDSALDLLRKFSPIEVDGNDNPLPESYKMLWVDPKEMYPPEPGSIHEDYTCHICGRTYNVPQDLDTHMLAFHRDDMEGRQTVKRGPGRPKKEVQAL